MQRQRYPGKQRRRKPPEEERMPPSERPVMEGKRQKAEELKEKAQALKEELEKIRERIRQEARELKEETQRLEELLRKKEKPSFSTMEEWLEEMIIDPSFFFLKERFSMLFRIFEGIRPKVVIIPTDLHNILSVRSRTDQVVEYIEKEHYYPALVEFITKWEAPTKIKRKETLRWISSADFWSLSSDLLRSYKVVPASEYQGGRYGINPIDVEEVTRLIGETAGQAFYEMLAVSEKTGRAIVSRTHAFVRLCRKLRIPTYESYTDWKDNFRRRHGFKGKFLILVISAGAYGLSSIVSQTLPAPIQQMGPFIIGAIVYDG